MAFLPSPSPRRKGLFYSEQALKKGRVGSLLKERIDLEPVLLLLIPFLTLSGEVGLEPGIH